MEYDRYIYYERYKLHAIDDYQGNLAKEMDRQEANEWRSDDRCSHAAANCLNEAEAMRAVGAKKAVSISHVYIYMYIYMRYMEIKAISLVCA